MELLTNVLFMCRAETWGSGSLNTPLSHPVSSQDATVEQCWNQNGHLGDANAMWLMWPGVLCDIDCALLQLKSPCSGAFRLFLFCVSVGLKNRATKIGVCTEVCLWACICWCVCMCVSVLQLSAVMWYVACSHPRCCVTWKGDFDRNGWV